MLRRKNLPSTVWRTTIRYAVDHNLPLGSSILSVQQTPHRGNSLGAAFVFSVKSRRKATKSVLRGFLWKVYGLCHCRNKKSNFASKVVVQKFSLGKLFPCLFFCLPFEGVRTVDFFVGKVGLCSKNHDTYADFCDILSVFSWRNDIFYCKFSVILSLCGKDWRSAKRRKNEHFADLFKK